MSRFLTSVAGIALMSSAALAADIPVYEPPVEVAPVMAYYDWTGFYVGAQGGWAFGEGIHTDTAGTTTGDYDIDGFLVGGTLGFNWQWNQVVLGLEGDLAWAEIEGDSTTNCAAGCFTEIDAIGTARVRLGYAFDRFMPYITGGAAFADVEVGQDGTPFGNDDWLFGWTAGGGVEVGITPNLSFKAEALYIDLEDIDYLVAIPVEVETNDLVVVRGGINWRF
jgi:outer membrane immunogenic protein